MTSQEVTSPVAGQGSTTRDADRGSSGSVAEVLEPVFEVFLDGPPPIRVEFWDGSALGSDNGPGVLRVGGYDRR